MPDNFRFDLTGRGDMSPAMQIAFAYNPRAVGFWIRPPAAGKAHRLVFFRTKPGNPTLDPNFEFYKPFDFEVNAEVAAELGRRFLLTADYGPKPVVRHDAQPVKGWRVYNETWSHVDTEWQGFAAVAPAWLLPYQRR